MTATTLRFCATLGCETVTTGNLCLACQRGETPEKRDVATMNRETLRQHEEMLEEFYPDPAPFVLPDEPPAIATVQPLMAWRFEGFLDDATEDEYLDMCEFLQERYPLRAFKRGKFEGRNAVFSTDGRRF